MKKVTISKELAEVIEQTTFIELKNYPHVNTVLYLTNWGTLKKILSTKAYNTLEQSYLADPITYIRAITEGYETELTPEEKIRREYQDLQTRHSRIREDSPQGNILKGRMEGIETTLNILNITVKGIND